jgi:shikimate kinase
MQDARNLILMGFMGTGKSVTGRYLAKTLNRRFIDMDDYIEARAGKSIPAIFAEDGEPAFRGMEREVVQELSRQQDLVIACGGGVVLNPDNVRDFSQTGVVIGLTASPEQILARVAGDTQRPLLQKPDREAAVRALLAERQPLYDALPVSVDTNGKTAAQVGDDILALLQDTLPSTPA